MFNLFRRDPLKKLQQDYQKKMDQAIKAQRSGKMPLYATLTAEAEEIAAEMDRLEKPN